MHICVTHVDVSTGIPCNIAPMSQGPSFPLVKGLYIEWAKLYEILAEVETGTRPMPVGFKDIEPELPILQWPLEVIA